MAVKTTQGAEVMSASSKTKKYYKKDIVNSSRYRDYRDICNALLKEGKKYSLAEVDRLIERFLKGE